MSPPPLPPDARTRAADLYQQYRDDLGGRLARRFPSADGDLIADAVIDAILDLSRQPERFDPARGTVRGFLFGAARRNLLRRVRPEERRRRREEKKGEIGVTESASADRSLLEELIGQELLDRARAFIARTDEERPAFDLWLRGDDDLSRWAVALNMPGSDPAEVQVRADKVRARFRQRQCRFRKRLAREDQEP